MLTLDRSASMLAAANDHMSDLEAQYDAATTLIERERIEREMIACSDLIMDITLGG